MAMRSFCSRHYKSNKSYCTVEWRNGWYRIFKWFFDRPSRPVIARVLRAIRNEWLKTWDCARFIFLNARKSRTTHVHRGRGEDRHFFSGMTVRLLPYDAIKQNTRALSFMPFARAPPLPNHVALPLRVNDVTIMSPSWIITIATDTYLYNSKCSGSPAGSNSIGDCLSPTSQIARHSPSRVISQIRMYRGWRRKIKERAFLYIYIYTRYIMPK